MSDLVMDRRAFIATLASGLLAAPLVAQAQPAKRVPRVGVLSLSETSQESIGGQFREGLVVEK